MVCTLSWFTPTKIPSGEGQKASAFGVGLSGWGQPTPAPLQGRGLEFGRFSREFKRINGPCPSKQTFRSTKDGNVNEASVSLQAGNEGLRLVATIAAYLAAIVGLCGRSPKLPTIKRNYAFNRGYQKCPNSRPLQGRGIIFMLNGAAPGGMGNSYENPP